jgi:RNA polymerase sigma factor (sigma-70 family)
MDNALIAGPAAVDDDRRIAEVVSRERRRLGQFIRRRVADAGDAEDILQDVWFELLESLRSGPIEQVGAWLFRVARNRIIDRFRRQRTQPPPAPAGLDADGEVLELDGLLPSCEAGPEAQYARRLLIEELDAALDELPAGQREVFVAHELEGLTYREIAGRTGIGLNTLLSRKHQAVLQLRRRLEQIYREFDFSGGNAS